MASDFFNDLLGTNAPVVCLAVMIAGTVTITGAVLLVGEFAFGRGERELPTPAADRPQRAGPIARLGDYATTARLITME